jgi:hypothetical protein
MHAALAAAMVSLAALAARGAEPDEERLYNLRVHLLPEDAQVELRRAAGDTLVCGAPCDKLVQFRRSDEFRLTGPDLAPSDDFVFRPRDGTVTLRVHPASQAPRTAAKGVLIASVVVLLTSNVILSVGNAQQVNRICYGTCDINSTQIAGLVGDGIGLVALIAGVVMWSSAPSTTWETVSP